MAVEDLKGRRALYDGVEVIIGDSCNESHVMPSVFIVHPTEGEFCTYWHDLTLLPDDPDD